MSAKSFATDRGMFDPNLPFQGIFDSNIFDTQIAPATVTHILLTAFTHSTSTITATIPSRELITVK